MRTKVWLAVAVAAVVSLGGCKPKEQVEAEKAAVKADTDQLQGRWKVASRSGEEDPEADETSPTVQYVIEGDIMKAVIKDEVLYRQKLTITPGKDPKQVDLTYVNADGKPETVTSRSRGKLTGKSKTKTTTLKDVAVYKVEGDTLTLCISSDEKKRPTDFTAAPGSAKRVLTLQRVKDGATDDTPATKAADEPKAPATKATEVPKAAPPATKVAVPAPTTPASKVVPPASKR